MAGYVDILPHLNVRVGLRISNSYNINSLLQSLSKSYEEFIS